MNAQEFELVFEHEVDRSRQVLVEKAKEYAADGDRMHNFYKAAHIDDETPEQALWGFLKKHIISLADMVKSGKDYPLAVWDEKLGDFLNYGYLLKALVVDQLPEDERAEFLSVLRDATGPHGFDQYKPTDITFNQYIDTAGLDAEEVKKHVGVAINQIASIGSQIGRDADLSH